ncbi:MAG: hypothetical protein QXE31_04845 [Candidatus Woesearchaeota archaeon]
MELHLLKEKEMKLLSRKRVSLEVDSKATPSRLELIKEISKKLNHPEDLIVIKHIYPQFGKNKAKVIAHLYQDKEKMKIFELKELLDKHKPKEEKKEQ